MHTSGDGATEDGGRLLAGRYRVTRQLGRGGMGVVCRAHDEVLGRDVAVKELRTFSDAAGPELAEFRLRMQREARAAARVRHPGVIAVHDIAEHEGRPVIVMELVDGPSLDDVLRERGTLDPVEAARIGAEVLDALAAAHRAGVLHRDVKPGNILLEHGGRVVLTDFGIAAVEEPGDGGATHLTRSGELVGSLDYLAPERARGENPGPASDVWSLGATLYAAVEGASPFRRTSTWSTLTAIVAEPLPEARNAGPLEPALRALMDKDPAQRAGAAAAATQLRQLADAGGGTAVGGAATMQLGAVRSPGRPGGTAPPHAYAEAPDGSPQPASPTGGVGGAAERDTDRGTLSTRRAERPSRRRTVVAAAVAAAALAGAGVAWAVSGLGPDGEKQPAAASQAPAAGQPSGSPSPGRGGRQAGAESRNSGPTPAVSASATEGDGRSPAPAAGGPDDGGGSGTGGGGGTDGGKGDGPGTTAGGSDTGGNGAAGGGSGEEGSTGGTSGGTGPEPACHPLGGGEYNCEVWRTAKSYNASHQHVGELYSGTNYFFCQQNTQYRETYGQWTNTWWAKTDDDSGNADVWVSVVYIRGGDDNQPVPGLPTC